MADTKKKYYTTNAEKMTVTIDVSVKPTKAEEKMVALLIAGGYTPVPKSEARSKKAKQTAAAETIKSKKDMDLTKVTDEEAETIKEMLKGSGNGTGFFAARAYYKDAIAKSEGFKNWADKKEAEKKAAEKKTDK